MTANRFFLLNMLLAAAILALFALIASDLISYRISRSFPLKSSTKTVATAPVRPDVLFAFAPIVEKGLFGSKTQGPLTMVTATAANQAAQAPKVDFSADLLLLGTVIGSFRETFAMIQRVSTKEERVFRLGDSVFDLGRLVAVQAETAAILADGKKVQIFTPTAAAANPQKTATAPAAPATPPGGAGGLASQVGSGSYVVDQRALNAALDNIGKAMTDARLLPSMKDGKVEGFRASEVKPQGIFGTIGIRNGDVLLRINDFPIDSPEKAIQSFASLKGQTRIKLDLIRDGQPQTFNYEIR